MSRSASGIGRIVLDSILLGSVTGLRSSLGPATYAVTGPNSKIKAAGLSAVAGELIVDKLPMTPSRLKLPSLLVRLIAGGGSSALVAHRGGHGRSQVGLAAGVGLLSALGASFAGARWRRWAGARFGKDLPGALIEDSVGLAVSAAVARKI